MSKLVKSNLPRSKFPFILGRGGSKLVMSNLPRSKFPFILGRGVSKLVKSNMARSQFPFIWGGCQSWSSQICLDLNFPLFFYGGGSPDFYLHTSRVKVKSA